MTAQMDIQTILIFILSILTITMVVIGVYVVTVLQELKKTIQRTNLILEDIEGVSNLVSNPLNIVTAAVKGFTAIKNLRKEN